MAREFVFQRRINGVIDTFYPKTVTHNIVRNSGNEEIPLDTILDGKGAFMQYTESVAEKSTDNDLMFEVLGAAIDGETIYSLRGTIIGTEPPSDTRYMWLDKSGVVAVLRYYDDETETWEAIDITGGQSGVGTVIGASEPANTTCLWLDTSSGCILKYYDETTGTWTAIQSTWG